MGRQSNYRYSIIPPAAATDPRIKLRSLQVLILLGRHANNNGWCRRSQVKMAEELGCGRSTVQRAIDNLVACGYVQRHAESKTENWRDSAYFYRVMIDHETVPTYSGQGDDDPEYHEEVPAQSVQSVPTSRAPIVKGSTVKDPESDSSFSLSPTEEKLGRKKSITHTAEAERLYNEFAVKYGWRQVKKQTGQREARLRRCLRAGGLDEWRGALEKAAASDFCCGKVIPRDGRPPFRMGIDFLLQETSYAKLLEGFYDNAGSARGGGGLFGTDDVDPEKCAQRTVMRLWKERGTWVASEYGDARPGQPGCRIMPEVLREFGYGTVNGHAN